MNCIILNILDCSLNRKFKPVQNLSLFFFTLCWLLIFITLLFNNKFTDILFYALIILSLVALTIFIILSILIIKKKRVRIVTLTENQIIINKVKIYDIKDFYFDFNVNQTKDSIDKNHIKKLPFWGNYIISKKNNIKIEIEPEEELKYLLPFISINNTKRSAFSMKTTDLFKSFMDILWAAS